MPNWVRNRLYVSGFTSDNELQEFVKRIAGDAEVKLPLSFQSHAPCSEEEKGNAWGTTEDAYRVLGPTLIQEQSGVMSHTGRCVLYSFETPWNPPLEWLDRLGKTEVGLRISLVYAEPGNAFFGVRSYDRGTLSASEEYESYAIASFLEVDALSVEPLWCPICGSQKLVVTDEHGHQTLSHDCFGVGSQKPFLASVMCEACERDVMCVKPCQVGDMSLRLCHECSKVLGEKALQQSPNK
jgi:hypothetical protein